MTIDIDPTNPEPIDEVVELGNAQKDDLPPDPESKEDTYAIIGLVVSLISLSSWFFPVIGLIISGSAIILGILGQETKSQFKKLAQSAIILGSVSLVLAIIMLVLKYVLKF